MEAEENALSRQLHQIARSANQLTWFGGAFQAFIGQIGSAEDMLALLR